MACVNDESRLSFSASSSGRYLSSFSILGLERGGESVSVQHKKSVEKKKPNCNRKKKVVQLCNYGVPRILCADGALHVATGRLCAKTSPLLCVFVGSPTGRRRLYSSAAWMEMGEQKRRETGE